MIFIKELVYLYFRKQPLYLTKRDYDVTIKYNDLMVVKFGE
jgi:hypothetical protein